MGSSASTNSKTKQDNPYSEYEGCIIHKTEYRGITIRQLNFVLEQIKKRCVIEKWTRDTIDIHGTKQVLKLTPEIVNLYDIIDRIIKRDTATKSNEKDRNYKLDMYTACNYNVWNSEEQTKHAVGITDGLAEIDQGDFYKKSLREENFPFDRIEKVVHFDILQANSSVPMDCINIKNAITGNEINKVPPVDHENYDKLNNTLRGRFVASAIMLLIETENVLMRPYFEILKHSNVENMNGLFFSDSDRTAILGCQLSMLNMEHLLFSH
eukprot:gene6133-8457_t